jgi:hypothetical protein
MGWGDGMGREVVGRDVLVVVVVVVVVFVVLMSCGSE